MINGIIKTPRRSLLYGSMLSNLQQWKDDTHPRRQLSSYSIHNLRPEGMYGYIRKLHTLLFTPYLKKFGEEEVTDMSMKADEILLKKLVDTKLIYNAATYMGEESA